MILTVAKFGRNIVQIEIAALLDKVPTIGTPQQIRYNLTRKAYLLWTLIQLDKAFIRAQANSSKTELRTGSNTFYGVEDLRAIAKYALFSG